MNSQEAFSRCECPFLARHDESPSTLGVPMVEGWKYGKGRSRCQAEVLISLEGNETLSKERGHRHIRSSGAPCRQA
jgi:hypothetical protein